MEVLVLDSCVGQNYGGKAAYIHAIRGVLAGRLAGHETMPASNLIHGAPPLTHLDQLIADCVRGHMTAKMSEKYVIPARFCILF